MIVLSEEIAYMIKLIEAAGFSAYAVGGCIRDSLLGREPQDWDLASNAPRNVLEALFPGAAIVNRKLGVMRISEGKVTADIAAYRIDGEYKDFRRPETVLFTDDIAEDLRRRDFTMNAIAVSPGRGVADPYCGKEDIEKRLIRGIGDPGVRFEEDALRILRGIRFAAQLGFEIEEETLRAMEDKAALLTFISIERIREEFTKTVTAPYSGKGLALFRETGVLPYVLGEACTANAGTSEWERFECLIRGIDQVGLTEGIDQVGLAEGIGPAEKSDPIDRMLNLRLALIYLCFEKDRTLSAIEWLGYSNEKKSLLRCGVGLIDAFERIEDKVELKALLGRIGLQIFSYLMDLSEQRCRIFGCDGIGRVGAGESPARRNRELLLEIQSNGEPVFLRDLAVNGRDLIEAGVEEGAAIGKTLGLLLETVHRFPEKNEKGQLLELAAKGRLTRTIEGIAERIEIRET
jgi:tRNA nucleotidyltransferase (CCA-adding enzyme)